MYGKDGAGAGLWVATGPKIATSTDGTNWTAVPTGSTSGFIADYRDALAYGKDNLGVGLWVAGGENGTNKIVTSRNGTDWAPATLVGGITTWYSVAYNGVDKWVAGGGGSVIATSSDGTNWYAIPSAQVSTISLVFGVAYGNGLWVAVGQDIRYSPNGTNWTITTTAKFSRGFSVAYGKDDAGAGLWVMVGTDNDSNYNHALIAYSSNGSAWTTIPSASLGGLYFSGNNYSNVFSVTYGNGLWVVGGDYGPKIATSTSGKSWNAVPSNGGIRSPYGIASKPIPV